MAARLVIAPNWLGDVVMSLPFLRAVRCAYPDDRLVVAARRNAAGIYRAEGSAEVCLRSRLSSEISAARRAGFQEAWLLPNSFRSALAPFLARIPERIGYATDGRALLLTHSVPLPPRTGHQLRNYDVLLRSRGIEPELGPPRLPVPPEAAGRAREALERVGLPREVRPILLAPAAAFGWTKRWPAERYAYLADLLSENGQRCGLVIGPGEQKLGWSVRQQARHPLPILGEDLDGIELAALLASARLLVANDSGPMHLAAAVGTPVVAFFGPTDPGRTAPLGSPSRILDRYVFCSPCFLKECPYGHECMREIKVEHALAAVQSLLG